MRTLPLRPIATARPMSGMRGAARFTRLGEMVPESKTLRALATLVTLAPRCTGDRSFDAGKVKVEGYCCPVPRVLAGEKVEGFCCPVPSEPLESPSVARRGPTALLSL